MTDLLAPDAAEGGSVRPDARGRRADAPALAATPRTAVAEGRVVVGAEALARLREGALAKGDALAAAQVAAVLGAKQTSRLIPRCHDVLLHDVHVEFELDEAGGAVDVRAVTRTDGPTGVEMEALMAVSVAALTIVDMVKSVAKGAESAHVRLLAKTGGRSGGYRRASRN